MFQMLIVLLFIFKLSHGYYYLLDTFNGCLGNCLQCDLNNLEFCIGNEKQMCMPGYSPSLSHNGQCIPDQNHRDEIKQLEHFQQQPLIRGWSHSEHQICNYYKPNGQIQRFNVLGFFYEHTIQNKQFFIKAYHRSAIITFNIVRNSWNPISDYLMIKLSTDNKLISENQVSFSFRDYIEQQRNRFKCHGVSFKLQKYQIHVPLGQHNDARLMLTFESFMNGESTWGITNIHMLIGCSHFIIPDSEGQCTQCQVGFYKIYKDNMFYGCQRCPNMCLECQARNVCLICAPGTNLHQNNCVFQEGFHQILIPAIPTSFCGYNSFIRSKEGKVVIMDTLLSYHILLSLSFIILYDPSQWDDHSIVKLIINQKIVHIFTKDSFKSFSTGQCSQFITNVYEQQKLITPFLENSNSHINLTIQAYSDNKHLFFGIKSNQIHYMYYYCINHCILCQLSTKRCQQCIEGYYLQNNQCILNFKQIYKKTNITMNNSNQNTQTVQNQKLQQPKQNQTQILENNIQTTNHLHKQIINTNSNQIQPQNTKQQSKQNNHSAFQSNFDTHITIMGKSQNNNNLNSQNLNDQSNNSQNQSITIVSNTNTSLIHIDNEMTFKTKQLNQKSQQNPQIINKSSIQNTPNKSQQQQDPKQLQKSEINNITVQFDNYNLTNIQDQQPKQNENFDHDIINTGSKKTDTINSKDQNIGKKNNQTINNQIITNMNSQNKMNQNKTKNQSNQIILNESNKDKKQSQKSQPNDQSNSSIPHKQTFKNQTKQLIENQLGKIQMHLFLNQQTRGIKVRINLQKNHPKISKVINKVTNTQEIFQQSKEIKVNYQQIKICLKQSFIDGIIGIYQQDIQKLMSKQQYKQIKQFKIKRFDFFSKQAIQQMKYLGSLMRFSSWICLAGMIICLPLGVGIGWEQFSLCLQMLFLYTYLHSQYLPPTIKIPLGSLYRMQNLNYFWKELSLQIEQFLLGNVVQYSPLIFTQYHIDINLTRALFPIFLINIYYSIIFGIILAVSHLISNQNIILNSRISVWLSKIAYRKINYFNQIWRYQFVAIIWACILQFYNLQYPQNSNRSNQLNTFICFIVFIFTICWPIWVYIYCKVNQFQPLQVYYYLEGIFYHKVLPTQPLKHTVYLYIHLRYIKYILFIVTIATLYNYPLPILLSMAVIELIEIIYIIKFNIIINSISLKLKVIQNIIFILIDIVMITIVQITRISSQSIFFYVGNCAFFLMTLAIVNCYMRTIYLLYCKISQILFCQKTIQEVLEPPLTQKNITHT